MAQTRFCCCCPRGYRSECKPPYANGLTLDPCRIVLRLMFHVERTICSFALSYRTPILGQPYHQHCRLRTPHNLLFVAKTFLYN